MKKLVKLSVILLAVVGVVAGCAKNDSGTKDSSGENKVVKLGLIGDDTDVWDSVKDRLKDEGIELEYVKFTDYNQPNAALSDGSIDLNSFQHQIFLDNYNEEHGTDLVSIANTVNAPLGIYSDTLENIEDIKENGEVAIPNDVTNGGRALILLETAGLIKVDPSKGTTPTVSDITDNPKSLNITELEASQTARALQDVALSVINSGMAVDAGLVPDQDSIFIEPVDDKSKPYVNLIAARKEDQDNETYQKVVDTYQSEETIKVIEETSKGSSVPAWDTFGKK